MNEIEDDHHSQHQHRIKDIQIVLMPEQVSIVALDILDDPKYRPNHDEEASGVKGVYVLVPRTVILVGFLGRDLVYADIEGERYEGEASKEDDLHKESDDDYFLSQMYRAEASGGQDSATWGSKCVSLASSFIQYLACKLRPIWKRFRTGCGKSSSNVPDPFD